MDDIFQEVGLDELPKVIEVAERDWPQHFLFHQYVKIMAEYKKANIQSPKQCLYRYGDIQDGVYLVETMFKNETPIAWYFLYTISSDLTDLTKVMAETSRIPWTTTGYIFEITMDRFTPSVEKAFASQGIVPHIDYNFMYWLPPEEKCEIGELPADVYLDFLDDSHVTEVNTNWPFKFPGSPVFLSQEISNNFGLGLFRKSDKKMLSSAISCHSGGIFVLYTGTEFRGRGYAEIIIRGMVKEIRRRGRIPFATIIQKNIISLKVFKRSGFKNFCEVRFIKNLGN